jgi:hypothetical protein
MLKRIRNVHSLFYLPLAFLAFPVLGVFFFGYPVCHILLQSISILPLHFKPL